MASEESNTAAGATDAGVGAADASRTSSGEPGVVGGAGAEEAHGGGGGDAGAGAGKAVVKRGRGRPRKHPIGR